jgi:predicted Zn-dependent peptidase
MHKDIATQHYGLQMAASADADDPRRYPAKLLAMVLGDETGSRLFWELTDPGLAESVSMHHCEYDGAGAMLLFLSCAPSAIDDNLKRITAVFERAAEEGLSVEELRQAKNKARSRIVLSAERPRGRLFSLGPDWLYRGEYRSVEDDLATIDQMRVDELHDLLRAFPLTQNTTVTVGPNQR